jgi:hypothetical protein
VCRCRNRLADHHCSQCFGVNLKNIFISLSVWQPQLFPLLTGLSSLKKLGISLQGVFGHMAIDFTHTLFANITHLLIVDQDSVPIAEGLARIPNLTHFGVGYEGLLDQIPHILQMCPKLQYFISVSPSSWRDETNEQMAATTEEFLFFVVVYGLFHEDWRSDAESGQDFWARARKRLLR